MVPQCYMLLYPCVYDLKQYSDLYNSCTFCFLFWFVLQFKIENRQKNRCCDCFRSGQLNDHSFGEKLFIRFTVRVHREGLSICVCASFAFGFDGEMWDLIILVSDHCVCFFTLKLVSVPSFRN